MCVVIFLCMEVCVQCKICSIIKNIYIKKEERKKIKINIPTVDSFVHEHVNHVVKACKPPCRLPTGHCDQRVSAHRARDHKRSPLRPWTGVLPEH